MSQDQLLKPSRLQGSLLVLGLLLGFMLIVRLPVIYCQPGGQDEDVYAIPGYTVSQEGIPRAPYYPSRDLDSVYYKADECLFAEPPASFYWQGFFFLVFPPVYGTARLASLVAGLFAIVLVHELGRRWTGSHAVALLGAGIYSVSRLFYFPAITARPDMLCNVFGLAALLLVTVWLERRSKIQLALAGLMLGFGGITHPFAIAYSIQIGLFVLWQEEGWRRKAGSFLWLVGWSLLPVLLWVPLILSFPDAARVQIVNNLLKPAGGGLLLRLIWPWKALCHHALLMLDHAGIVQWLLLGVGLIGSTVLDLRSGDSRRRTCTYWMWSSTYLLAACAGVHPTKGYWCWPAAFICLGLARVCLETGRFLERRMRLPREESSPRTAIGRLTLTLPTIVVLAALVQGSGLRASWAYLTRATDENYNAPRFAQRLLRELPEEARYTVDIDYALDFYVAGRKTIIAQTVPFYFRAQDFPYDWLVRGRFPHMVDMPGRLNAELVRVIPTPDDPFACQASLYRQRSTVSE
ncbi:MAG: glycosyltransferase family 39 protein [Planctomycetota bacterium]